MQFHLGRNGQSLGIFSEEQVRAGMADGTFLGTDLAWQEGMDDWKPLSSFSLPGAPPLLTQRPSTVPTRVPMAAPPASTNSGLATASLICGIGSVPGFFCCLALPLALAAIICGHLAMAEITRNPRMENSRGMAKGGLIMGYIVIVLYILLIIFQVGLAGLSTFMDASKW